MPTAPKLRHSARSRGIHLCLPTHQAEKPVPTALQHGYCDFAQYDGVGRARASLSSGTPLPSFPKCLSNPNAVIPGVAAESKPRHSPQCPLRPNFVIPRAVAESIFACQRISQRSQCPLHSTMDTATSRSMTVLVGQGRLCPLALFSRHSRSSCRTQTPSFRAQSRNPSPRYQRIRQLRNPAPTAPKLRHSARSRGIHLCLPTHQAEKPVPSALHYGYCDFAQYDGVGRASASLSSATLLPSFPKCLSNPNFVIPGVAAESKPRHSPQCPLHPNFVIPRAVAESIFACQRIRQRSQRPLHSTMDTATSRSMTVLVGQGRLCPLALFSRHSRSACRIQTPSFL